MLWSSSWGRSCRCSCPRSGTHHLQRSRRADLGKSIPHGATRKEQLSPRHKIEQAPEAGRSQGNQPCFTRDTAAAALKMHIDSEFCPGHGEAKAFDVVTMRSHRKCNHQGLCKSRNALRCPWHMSCTRNCLRTGSWDLQQSPRFSTHRRPYTTHLVKQRPCKPTSRLYTCAHVHVGRVPLPVCRCEDGADSNTCI